MAEAFNNVLKDDGERLLRTGKSSGGIAYGAQAPDSRLPVFDGVLDGVSRFALVAHKSKGLTR